MWTEWHEHGWTMERESRFPLVFRVCDPQDRFVGEIRRGWSGRWSIHAGTDGSVATHYTSREDAYAVLRQWWISRGQHLPGPRRDPAED